MVASMNSGGTEPGKNLSKLKGRIAQSDGFTVIRLDGVIDEHNELSALLDPVGSGGTLLIDLGGIKRLNSVGVRDWVNWLRALRPRWKQLVLFDCPPPVMNEVNFIKNFAEGAHITTFAVPLFCPLCNKEESRIFATAGLRVNGRVKLPNFACGKPACENAIDDDEESYFGFLESLPDAPEPARLMQLTVLARTAAATAPPIARTELGAGQRASATRLQPLEQLGQRASNQQPTSTSAIPSLPSDAAVPLDERVPGRGDWLFVAAMIAMVAVLGVLIYLILTLE